MTNSCSSYFVPGTDSFLGQAQGFHGSRGRRKAQMRYCMRLIRCMASLSNSLINQDLCDQGAISQLHGERVDLIL